MFQLKIIENEPNQKECYRNDPIEARVERIQQMAEFNSLHCTIQKIKRDLTEHSKTLNCLELLLKQTEEWYNEHLKMLRDIPETVYLPFKHTDISNQHHILLNTYINSFQPEKQSLIPPADHKAQEQTPALVCMF